MFDWLLGCLGWMLLGSVVCGRGLLVSGWFRLAQSLVPGLV